MYRPPARTVAGVGDGLLGADARQPLGGGGDDGAAWRRRRPLGRQGDAGELRQERQPGGVGGGGVDEVAGVAGGAAVVDAGT
jgi:hypothetical protein